VTEQRKEGLPPATDPWAGGALIGIGAGLGASIGVLVGGAGIAVGTALGAAAGVVATAVAGNRRIADGNR